MSALRARIGATAGAVALAAVAAATVSAPAHADTVKVASCHATGSRQHPYEFQSPNANDYMHWWSDKGFSATSRAGGNHYYDLVPVSSSWASPGATSTVTADMCGDASDAAAAVIASGVTDPLVVAQAGAAAVNDDIVAQSTTANTWHSPYNGSVGSSSDPCGHLVRYTNPCDHAKQIVPSNPCDHARTVVASDPCGHRVTIAPSNPCAHGQGSTVSTPPASTPPVAAPTVTVPVPAVTPPTAPGTTTAAPATSTDPAPPVAVVVFGSDTTSTSSASIAY